MGAADFIERFGDRSFPYSDALFALLESEPGMQTVAPDGERLSCAHYARIWAQRARVLDPQLRDYETLKTDYQVLADSLGRTPESACALWVFLSASGVSYAVYVIEPEGEVAGCIATTSSRPPA